MERCHFGCQRSFSILPSPTIGALQGVPAPYTARIDSTRGEVEGVPVALPRSAAARPLRAYSFRCRNHAAQRH